MVPSAWNSSARLRLRIARTTPAFSKHDGRWTVQGDPTEGALLVAARKCGLSADALDKRLPRVGEVPFSSERKLMSTIHRDTEQEHARHRVHQGRARRAAGAMRL